MKFPSLLEPMRQRLAAQLAPADQARRVLAETFRTLGRSVPGWPTWWNPRGWPGPALSQPGALPRAAGPTHPASGGQTPSPYGPVPGRPKQSPEKIFRLVRLLG